MFALRCRASSLWKAIIRLLNWVYRRRQRRRLWQAVKPVIDFLRELPVRRRQPVGWSEEPFFQRQLLSGIGIDSIGDDKLGYCSFDWGDGGSYCDVTWGIDWGDDPFGTVPGQAGGGNDKDPSPRLPSL